MSADENLNVAEILAEARKNHTLRDSGGISPLDAMAVSAEGKAERRAAFDAEHKAELEAGGRDIKRKLYIDFKNAEAQRTAAVMAERKASGAMSFVNLPVDKPAKHTARGSGFTRLALQLADDLLRKMRLITPERVDERVSDVLGQFEREMFKLEEKARKGGRGSAENRKMLDIALGLDAGKQHVRMVVNQTLGQQRTNAFGLPDKLHRQFVRTRTRISEIEAANGDPRHELPQKSEPQNQSGSLLSYEQYRELDVRLELTMEPADAEVLEPNRDLHDSTAEEAFMDEEENEAKVQMVLKRVQEIRMEGLTDRQRTIWELVHDVDTTEDPLTYAQVAERLGLGFETVKRDLRLASAIVAENQARLVGMHADLLAELQDAL